MAENVDSIPENKRQHSESEINSQQLIDRALKEGRSIIDTWTAAGDLGIPGMQSVHEQGDTNQDVFKNPGGSPSLQVLTMAFGDFQTVDRVTREFPKQGIREIVLISKLPPREITEEQVVERSEKGLFGRSKKVRATQTVVVGQKARTIGEFNNQASDPLEEAIILTYSAKGEGHTDAHHRPGNHLDMQLALPGSMREQLLQAISEDPTVVRRLSESLVQARYSPEFKNGWEKYGRPPYLAWDNSPTGNKMFLADLTQEQLPISLDSQTISHHLVATRKN